MEKEPILQMVSRHVYDKPFRNRFPDRRERKKGVRPDRKGGLIWYTDDSKTKKALELGCIAMERGGNLVLALGSTVVFQAEVYSKACTVENLVRDYEHLYSMRQ
jgi:hypothetical protein